MNPKEIKAALNDREIHLIFAEEFFDLTECGGAGCRKASLYKRETGQIVNRHPFFPDDLRLVFRIHAKDSHSTVFC